VKFVQSLTVLALLCVAATQSIAGEGAGNYELLICKSACSFEHPQSAVAKGLIVLSEDPLPRDVVEKIRLSHFVEPNHARACFVGTQSERAKTFAFLTKAMSTSWALENGVLKFELFRSADAGYEVELERKSSILVGKGMSWGAGVAAPHFTPDIVVGRRIGPVNVSACLEPAI
jgi:hypothetical protein